MSLGIQMLQYQIAHNTAGYPGIHQGVLRQPSLSAPAPAQQTDRFSLDHFQSSQLGGSFDKRDVLTQLWRDAHAIDLNDPERFAGLCFDPTEEDLADLADQMEAQGLNGAIDFGKLTEACSTRFSTVHAGNLGDAIEPDAIYGRSAAAGGGRDLRQRRWRRVYAG